MAVSKAVREAVLLELQRRAAKGDLTTRQMNEMAPLLEQGINVPNLVALGYLSPLNVNDPSQVKRAATAYRKSLEASPAARRREQTAGGRERGTTEYFEEDLAPIVTRSPEELYGSVLIPNVGDTTATGRTVTRYGGFDPEIPIESHGGPDFPRQMQERGMPYGWASNRDAAAKKQTQFNEVARTTEREPIAVTTAMGYDANFFAAPYADAFIQKARQLKIPAKDAKVFDEMVRNGVGNLNKKTGKMQYSIAPFPDWVGINHPEARDQLLGLNGYPNIGARRVTVMTAAAKQKKFREMGFPVVEDIHRAMQMEGSEGLQRGDAGFTLYKPEVGAEVEPIDFHQSYDTGIRGQYFGQIEGVSVPPEIMFPDIMADYAARGKSRADAIGGFMMNTGLRQIADQKWLDNISRYLEANPEQRKLMVKALAGAGIISASSQSQAGPLTFSKGGKEAAQRILDTTADRIVAEAGALSTETKRLVDMGYPEPVAERIASGELDMSPQARLARQQEAFPDIVYHGSMQDIVGEYIPKYRDNLMFTTPDPEFASDWAGKGAMQTRVGELDAFDRYRPQKQKLYEEFGSPEYGTPEYDEFSKKATEIYNQERNAFKTLYPLAVKAKNPFDPTAEGMYEKVTEPLFKKKFGVEKLDPSTEEYLRKGAYLYFEDPDVIKELQDMGYDAIKLRESTDGPLNTLAMFDGSKNVRSLLSAAFDPKYTGSNIMGSRVIPTAATGLLGSTVLGSALAPEDAEAGPLTSASKLRNVFPAPQRFFDPEDRAYKPFLGEQFEPQAGGRYLQMGDGPPRDITGEYPDYGRLDISPEGKPSFKVSEGQATAPATKGGRKIKTNLFKRKAGWKWTKPPEGFDPDPAGDFPIISVHDGKSHYYTLSTEFPEGVELARYEKSATEPRLRPTRQGEVELGEVVGEISVRGKTHPVYNRAVVKGLAGAGMTVGTAGLAINSEDTQASLLGVGSTIGKKAQDMLGMAITMRDKGLTPTEIWEKTGWEFNEVDGRWRTEHTNYENTKINMPESEGVYSIRDVIDDPDLLSAFDDPDYQSRVLQMYDFSDPQARMGYQRLAFNRGSLRDLAIEITPELKAGDGALNGNYIQVGAGTRPDDFRNVVLHELQHAIQQRENFASGSNPELFEAVQDVQIRDEFYDMPYEEKKKTYEMAISNASRFLENPPPDATVDQMTQARRVLDSFTNQLNVLEQYNIDSMGGSRSPYRMYEATAGEVEARNVETRDAPRRLTREYGPAESEGLIPRDEQIYIDDYGAPYYTIKDGKTVLTPFRSSQGPDIDYPRRVTVGQTRTPEVQYDVVQDEAGYNYGGGATIPVRPEPSPTRYDYGDGATIPLRPKPSGAELMSQANEEFRSNIVPIGVGGADPYSFLMSGGMSPIESTNLITDVYSNIGRGALSATLGSLGELETLLVGGLLPAIVGVGYGSPIERAMIGMQMYDPQFPNTKDVQEFLPTILPTLSDITPEEEALARTIGEFASPL
jgi:hypothetical protein